jgi:hypothetical protein
VMKNARKRVMKMHGSVWWKMHGSMWWKMHRSMWWKMHGSVWWSQCAARKKWHAERMIDSYQLFEPSLAVLLWVQVSKIRVNESRQ